MNERSDTDDKRDAFDVLVAARPNPPAGLTSPDTWEAEALLRRIVSEPVAAGKPQSRRRYFPIIVGAGAAAAVIGILAVVPGENSPRSAGSVATAPASNPGDEWPAIPESPPVGEANTAQATVIYDEQWSSGRTDYVMADGDVSILVYGSPVPADGMPPVSDPEGPGPSMAPTVIAENRYVGGEWYYHLQGENGDMQWSYDPDDDPIGVEASSSDPRELYDRLSPTAAFEADGTDFVRGMETVHLVATTPETIDPSLVPFSSPDTESVMSLELWLDSNGIVRRLDVTYTVPTPVFQDLTGETVPIDEPYESARTSIEFYDIGEPITIEVPRGAVEIDAVG